MPFKDKTKRRQYQKKRKKEERERKKKLKEQVRQQILRQPSKLMQLRQIRGAAEIIFSKRELTNLQKIANSMKFPSLAETSKKKKRGK